MFKQFMVYFLLLKGSNKIKCVIKKSHGGSLRSESKMLYILILEPLLL